MLKSMCEVLKEAYDRKWITSKDGNTSVKIDDRFFITPSGVRKNKLRPFDILKGRISLDKSKNIVMPKGAIPSGEFTMHEMLSRGFSSGAILHLHPTNILAAVESGFNLKELAEDFPELARYTRVGATVGIYPICSEELACATYNNMYNSDNELICDIVAQERHGVTAIGSTPWEAFEHIERLEHICTIILRSK